MSTTSAIRWSVAVVAFLVIGVLDLRYGHSVGLSLLIVALLVVFVLDLGAKKQ